MPEFAELLEKGVDESDFTPALLKLEQVKQTREVFKDMLEEVREFLEDVPKDSFEAEGLKEVASDIKQKIKYCKA